MKCPQTNGEIPEICTYCKKRKICRIKMIVDKHLEKKCCIENCENVLAARGLCAKHYRYASRKVEDGTWKWKQLYKKFLAFPLKKEENISNDWKGM